MEGNELRLENGATTLEGIVRREGHPIRGATLCLSGPVAQSAVSREDGTFAIRGLVPGSYTLNTEVRASRQVGRWSSEQKLELRTAGAAHRRPRFSPVSRAQPEAVSR